MTDIYRRATPGGDAGLATAVPPRHSAPTLPAMPVSPPTARDPYVIGKLGSYFAPTVAAVDRHLAVLGERLLKAPASANRIRTDIDTLLEHRSALAGP